MEDCRKLFKSIRTCSRYRRYIITASPALTPSLRDTTLET